MRKKKYTIHHTFRCDKETQLIIENLLSNLELNKSELIRECIKKYNDLL